MKIAVKNFSSSTHRIDWEAQNGFIKLKLFKNYGDGFELVDIQGDFYTVNSYKTTLQKQLEIASSLWGIPLLKTELQVA